ncbi:MAG TPA: IclR family transcriptional regulator [Anaerolineales bacterium]
MLCTHIRTTFGIKNNNFFLRNMTSIVTSVERAFQILRLFENGQPERGVSEISRALNIHKSTAHNIAQTLCKLNILEQNPLSLKYYLGSGLVNLGNMARQRLDVRPLARPFMQDLAEETRASVFLGVFENDGITIVEKAEAPEEMRISAPIGQRVPFSGGSFGQAFLAYMPPSEVDRLLMERGLRSFTRTSVTDPLEYRDALARIKNQGYAVDNLEEYLEGVWAVSVPIFDGDGVTAVLTAVNLTARIDASKAEMTIEATAEVARELTARMGGKDIWRQS